MSLSQSNSPKYSTKKNPPSPVVPSQQQSLSSSSPTSLLGAKELQERLHILLTKLATTTKLIQTWPSEQQTSGGGDSSSSVHVETTTKLIESIKQLIIALKNVEGTIKTNTILKKQLQSCQVPINLLDLLDHGNGLNPDCFSRGLLREALGQLAGLKRRKLALEMLGAAVQAGLDQKDNNIAIVQQQKAEGEKSDMDVVDDNTDEETNQNKLPATVTAAAAAAVEETVSQKHKLHVEEETIQTTTALTATSTIAEDTNAETSTQPNDPSSTEPPLKKARID